MRTPDPTCSIDDTCRKRFEQARRSDEPAEIEQFLPPEDDPRYLATLEELVCIDLEVSWPQREGAAAEPRSGRSSSPRRIEHYLQRFPQLNSPAAVRRLVREECLVRLQHGECPTLDEYRQRFPECPLGEEDFREVLREGGTSGAVPAIPGCEILGVLGRGGMGVVYKARQTALKRLVAVKMVTGPQGDADMLDRLRTEAELVARLQHPNVVQIHEVGQCEGRPYLVLEYVDGGDLAKQLGGQPQPAEAAARMVQTLARAVEAAHARGVLHRDLKPANVLLTADGTPKITDFGLAKGRDEELSRTRSGEIIGTPSYMAPEQASGKVGQIGPGTDIYALGTILYEMLTGRPPFQGPTVWDTIGQVIESDPVPPTRLQPKTPRDLETICLKCLQKEPSRRYSSAAELADDLGRFLNGEPILARPVGPLERLGKWAGRNRALARAAGIAVLAVLVALTTLAIAYVQVRASRDDALTAKETAERAREATAEALVRVEEQRERADKNFGLARGAVEKFLLRVTQTRTLRSAPLEPLRRGLLGLAQSFYEEFVQQAPGDAELESERGKGYLHLGEISNELGQFTEEIKFLRRAEAIFVGLRQQHPQDHQCRRGLAQAKAGLGVAQFSLGRHKEAETEMKEAATIFEELRREDPRDPGYGRDLVRLFNNLSLVYGATGRVGEAETALKASVESAERLARNEPDEPEHHRMLCVARINLGMTCQKLGRYPEAETALRAAVAGLDRITTADAAEHADADYDCRRGLGFARVELGALYRKQGQNEKAVQEFGEAVKVREETARQHPDVPALRFDLVVAHNQLAGALWTLQRVGEADAELRKAEGLCRKLVEERPDVPDYAAEFGTVLMNLGHRPYLAARYEEAGKFYLEAQAVLEKLVRGHPDVPQYRKNLAQALQSIGDWQIATGRSEEARASLQRSLEICEELLKAAPQSPEYAAVAQQVRQSQARLPAAPAGKR